MIVEVGKYHIITGYNSALSNPVSKAIKEQTQSYYVFVTPETVSVEGDIYHCHQDLANWLKCFQNGEKVEPFAIELNDEFEVAYLRSTADYDAWMTQWEKDAEAYEMDRFAAYDPCGIDF